MLTFLFHCLLLGGFKCVIKSQYILYIKINVLILSLRNILIVF